MGLVVTGSFVERWPWRRARIWAAKGLPGKGNRTQRAGKCRAYRRKKSSGAVCRAFVRAGGRLGVLGAPIKALGSTVHTGRSYHRHEGCGQCSTLVLVALEGKGQCNPGERHQCLELGKPRRERKSIQG